MTASADYCRGCGGRLGPLVRVHCPNCGQPRGTAPKQPAIPFGGCWLGLDGPDRQLHNFGDPYISRSPAVDHAADCPSYARSVEFLRALDPDAWYARRVDRVTAGEASTVEDLPIPGCPSGLHHPTEKGRAMHGRGAPFATAGLAQAHAERCAVYALLPELPPDLRPSWAWERMKRGQWQKLRAEWGGGRRGSGPAGYRAGESFGLRAGPRRSGPYGQGR
jgi:hypothetical protein